MIDEERVTRPRLDGHRDAVAVVRAQIEDAEDEEVERSLQEGAPDRFEVHGRHSTRASRGSRAGVKSNADAGPALSHRPGIQGVEARLCWTYLAAVFPPSCDCTIFACCRCPSSVGTAFSSSVLRSAFCAPGTSVFLTASITAW